MVSSSPIPWGEIAEGEIHRGDVVLRRVVDHPLQRLLDIREKSRSGVTEDLEGDDVDTRRNARQVRVFARNNARDVRAVAIDIACIRVTVGEVELIDDAIGHTIPITVRSEERMIEIDTGIDDHGRQPGAIDVFKAWIQAQAIQLHEVCSGSIAHKHICARAPDHRAGCEDRHRRIRDRVCARDTEAHRPSRARRRLAPTVLNHLGHDVRARQQIREGVATIGDCAHECLAGAEHLVLVGVDKDHPVPIAIPIAVLIAGVMIESGVGIASVQPDHLFVEEQRPGVVAEDQVGPS